MTWLKISSLHLPGLNIFYVLNSISIPPYSHIPSTFSSPLSSAASLTDITWGQEVLPAIISLYTDKQKSEKLVGKRVALRSHKPVIEMTRIIQILKM